MVVGDGVDVGDAGHDDLAAAAVAAEGMGDEGAYADPQVADVVFRVDEDRRAQGRLAHVCVWPVAVVIICGNALKGLYPQLFAEGGVVEGPVGAQGA